MCHIARVKETRNEYNISVGTRRDVTSDHRKMEVHNEKGDWLTSCDNINLGDVVPV
jgi:hypothetical protein